MGVLLHALEAIEQEAVTQPTYSQLEVLAAIPWWGLSLMRRASPRRVRLATYKRSHFCLILRETGGSPPSEIIPSRRTMPLANTWSLTWLTWSFPALCCLTVDITQITL